MTQLYPLLDALDSYTDELHRASPTTSIIGLYIQGLGRFFTSIRAWLGDRQEGSQVEEGSRRLREGLARVVVLGHRGLGLKALERWFVVSEEGDRLVESRRREEAEKGWEASERGWKGIIEVVEVSFTLGLVRKMVSRYQPADLSRYNDHQATLQSLGSDDGALISNMTTNPSGFLPYASLILLTCPGRFSGTRAMIDKVEDKEEFLRATMPVLGSAVQGLAVEAAWVWVGMVLEGSSEVDEMMVDILLEVSGSTLRLRFETRLIVTFHAQWLMPVMANDPSDLNRFALHRLAYRLIRSVGGEEAVVELFDKVGPDGISASRSAHLSVRLMRRFLGPVVRLTV